MTERREVTRTPLKASVVICHSSLGKFEAVTRELSDRGAFIVSLELTQLSVGDALTVQATGFPEEMPVLSARVARVDVDGIGIQFIM